MEGLYLPGTRSNGMEKGYVGSLNRVQATACGAAGLKVRGCRCTCYTQSNGGQPSTKVSGKASTPTTQTSSRGTKQRIQRRDTKQTTQPKTQRALAYTSPRSIFWMGCPAWDHT